MEQKQVRNETNTSAFVNYPTIRLQCWLDSWQGWHQVETNEAKKKFFEREVASVGKKHLVIPLSR